uniref:Uncharacterized protein n=1 Tax=Anguilla anguilla TaxID=7936 RepID=A0A0E9S935_ANGAN
MSSPHRMVRDRQTDRRLAHRGCFVAGITVEKHSHAEKSDTPSAFEMCNFGKGTQAHNGVLSTYGSQMRISVTRAKHS